MRGGADCRVCKHSLVWCDLSGDDVQCVGKDERKAAKSAEAFAVSVPEGAAGRLLREAAPYTHEDYQQRLEGQRLQVAAQRTALTQQRPQATCSKECRDLKVDFITDPTGNKVNWMMNFQEKTHPMHPDDPNWHHNECPVFSAIEQREAVAASGMFSVANLLGHGGMPAPAFAPPQVQQVPAPAPAGWERVSMGPQGKKR